MTKTNRRKFLLTAAAATVGALLSGIVQAEKPVIVEDIQAVPLGVQYLIEDNFDGPEAAIGARTVVNWGTGSDITVSLWELVYTSPPTYEPCELPIELMFQ